jgi:NADPH2:quinone reductase
LLAEGKINPLISKTVPMKDAVSSIEDIARRKILGKVVFLND